ncbi:MAG: DUF3526 domain-containing protein [Pseudomonadota bacterium]
MTIQSAALLERRLFLLAPPGLIAFAAIIAVVIFASLGGHSAVERSAQAQTAFTAEREASRTEWRESMAQIEAAGSAEAPYEARPMNIRIPAVLPPTPLGDFAIGDTEILPNTTEISGWSNPANLFSEYEFDNPTPLSLGSFDMTFIVVVLMPLLMIAVSFDLFASDRERGRARLLAAQTGQIAPTIWRRLIIRNAALWAVFAASTAIAALLAPMGADTGLRLTHFVVWLTIALLYGLFWFAAITLVSAILRRSETVASALFALWAIFVFAVPAVGGAIAEASYPPPSRLAYLSQMRQGEVKAVRETAELTSGFLADHPEMTVSDEDVPGYFSSTFLANEEARKRTAPVLEAFNNSRQQRMALVAKLQYLSPALIADRAMTAVAGGGDARGLAFQDQAYIALNDLVQRIGPAVVARQRISLAEYDAIPAFAFRERSMGEIFSTMMLPMVVLLLLTIALLIIAYRRMAAPLEQLL